MRVSVIVTTYNNPSALIRVLDGLSVQKRLPDEVIIADDGSGPETAEAIKNYAKMLFHMEHVWQEDMGFRAAKIRNEAIKRAKGQYIIILDGDCIPDRNFVFDHISLAEKGFFVQGKRVMVNKEASEGFSEKDANSPKRLLTLALLGRLSNIHHTLRIPFMPSFKGVWLKGIKSCNMGLFRDDLFAVNGFNERFREWGREDTELAVRLFRYGLKRKEHLFRAICYHLWHPIYSRDALEHSEDILKETLNADWYFCPDGIVKKDVN